MCIYTTGSVADPYQKPGLAHLCQHVLYSANEDKFFDSYVKENGGTISGYTETLYTTYCFDIEPSKFKKALTHFAGLFTKTPVFTEAAVKIGTSIVACEQDMNNLDDKRKTALFFREIRNHNRIMQIDRDLERKLKYIKRQRILSNIYLVEKFHKRFYSSELTSLCVIGRGK